MEKISGNTSQFVMSKFDVRETKYANVINDIAFDFSEQELNMLLAIITNMRDRGAQYTLFSFSEMKRAMGLGKTHMSNREFMQKLSKTLIKFCKATDCIQTEKTSTSILLFSCLFFDIPDRKMCIAVNPDFTNILNNPAEYTKFQLNEFIRINGKYAKRLYLHLCQFRTSGVYKVQLDKFRRLFCISCEDSKIKQKVINPCLNELRRLEEFKNLQYKTHYSHQNKIELYVFFWKASSTKDEETGKEEKPATSIEDVIAGEDAYDDDDLF